jgi:hypothetical protein
VDLSRTQTAADIVSIISSVFKGAEFLVPWCVADVNYNGAITATDIIYLVNYVFKSGPGPLPACDPEPTSYFPITQGSYWVYDIVFDTGYMYWTVTNHTADTAVVERPGDEWVSHGGTIRVSKQGAAINIDLPGVGWVPFYRFDAGGSWLHRDPFVCDDSALYVVVSEPDPVVTPAGSFFNCLRMDRLNMPPCADAGTRREWWAPNVGLVQWEEESFTGPRIYQLTAYAIVPE